MRLISALRAPGHGRRQAARLARTAAELARTQADLAREREARLAAQADHRRTASVLGDVVIAHLIDRDALATAVRSNRCNIGAVTVQTDVSAMHAAVADIVPQDVRPVPQRRPHRWPPGSVGRGVALWDSPLVGAGDGAK